MALIGLLVVGAAAASILGRVDWSVPRPELVSPTVQGPVANRRGKTDKLGGRGVALAPVAPPQAVVPGNESLRLAFAIHHGRRRRAEHPYAAGRRLWCRWRRQSRSLPASRRRRNPTRCSATRRSPASRTASSFRVRKSRIGRRWKVHCGPWPGRSTRRRKADPHATGAPIDPESAEVQQLKSAAMPLLFQLREDQKREVRTLARLIGLEQVASQI